MASRGAGASSSGGVVVMKDSRLPKYSKFTQQELPACKPILTPRLMICILLAVGFVFIPVGVAVLLTSRSVVEIVQQYDSLCVNNITTQQGKVEHIQNPTSTKNCAFDVNVARKMSAPVYVYYELDHFYQNHRRYIKSRSDAQLRGRDVADVKDCSPEDTFNGSPIVPCGLIAWSLFNDTFQFQIGGEDLQVDNTDISWKLDRNAKFSSKVLPSNFPNNNLTGGGNGGSSLNESVPLNKQEHLIVWMRPAPLPTFRKLWGKIDRDLVAGTVIRVNLENRYNVYSFDGHKKLVMSTASWLGGKNTFFGTAFLSVGVISVLLAGVFFLAHLKNPRRLGDMSRLSWNRNNQVTSSSSR